MTTLEIVLLIFCAAFFALALISWLVTLAEIRRLRYARVAGERRIRKRTFTVRMREAFLRLRGGNAELADSEFCENIAAESAEKRAPVSALPKEAASVSEICAAAMPETAASRDFAAASAENAKAETETVAFAAAARGTEKKTFAQRYEELLPDVRRRFDSVLEYVMSKPDCRKTQSNTSLTVKCKTDKYMRVLIRRGSVLLHFMLANSELTRFVREEGGKAIKIAPVVVRLDTDEDEDLARQTADIAMDELLAEQKYRKERLKEIRRQRRLRKEAAANEGEGKAE